MLHMRPAVDRLREQFDASYPLAHAKPFVAGRELVLKVQADVKLDRGLHIVVVRNDQVVLTDRAEHFWRSADFDEGDDGAEAFVHRLRPIAAIADVLIDPLRQFGEPVVRSVRTDVIAEQVRAGESLATVSELFELSIEQVEAAVRYELRRSAPADEDAA
jgi:uncharacterized protein (DUF433 family)